jgi:hypothetical protein
MLSRTLASGHAAEPEPMVVPFRPRAGGGRGAGGDRARRRRRPAARIIPWPHAWRPRRAADLDRAVAFVWKQHADGLITDIEAHARIVELTGLRHGLTKASETRGRPE